MNITSIDSVAIKELILTMAANLERNKNIVDALNVFPVPDGDTGTNMNLTIQSAVKEIANTNYSDVSSVAKAAANGSLLGARGNSGVILSQLLRGFAEGLKNHKQISTQIIANALKLASDTAYNAVMKPVEGTILTVARESAEKAVVICSETDDFIVFFDIVIEQAKDALRRTPEMLDVLKQAGVVDAGGQGYVFLLEGALHYLKGEKLEDLEIEVKEIRDTQDELELFSREEDIIFAYCTEFIINNAQISQEDFLRIIENKGDSIVCIKNEDLIKVHMHTNEPGYVLDQAGKFGELINIKIDNMRQQFREQQKNPPKKDFKKNTFIAIGMGDGIKKIFEDLGVDVVITGGQTMNPSTEDILNAVNSVNSDNIFILPNNSNIILAANQAKEISDKNLVVIPTKTVPQGISAMLSYDESAELKDNEEAMIDAIKKVKTGQVTFAVRDTHINEKDIKKGNIIALFDGDIVANGEDVALQTTELIQSMVGEEDSLITIIYGEDVDETDALEMEAAIIKTYTDCDVEIIYGGQPLYYYIISVE